MHWRRGRAIGPPTANKRRLSQRGLKQGTSFSRQRLGISPTVSRFEIPTLLFPDLPAALSRAQPWQFFLVALSNGSSVVPHRASPKLLGLLRIELGYPYQFIEGRHHSERGEGRRETRDHVEARDEVGLRGLRLEPLDLIEVEARPYLQHAMYRQSARCGRRSPRLPVSLASSGSVRRLWR